MGLVFFVPGNEFAVRNSVVAAEVERYPELYVSTVALLYFGMDARPAVTRSAV